MLFFSLGLTLVCKFMYSPELTALGKRPLPLFVFLLNGFSQCQLYLDCVILK